MGSPWMRRLTAWGRRPNRLTGKRGAARPPLRLEALEERCVPSTWVAQTSGTAERLFGVGGLGPNDVFAVGFNGIIQHSAKDRVSWQAMARGAWRVRV